MTDTEIKALYRQHGYFVDGPMFATITDSMRYAAEIFRANVEQPDMWIVVGAKRYPIADMVEYSEQAEIDALWEGKE